MDYERLNQLVDSGLWARLSPNGQAVEIVLERHANHDTGECYPARTRIAKEAGLVVNSVRTAIWEIVRLGLFKIIDRGPGTKGRSRYIYQRQEINPVMARQCHRMTGLLGDPVTADVPTLSRRDSKTSKKKTPDSCKVKIEFKEDSFEGISDWDLTAWTLAYPALNIEGELRRAAQWLAANPERRKKNYRRFIINWLARGQQTASAKVNGSGRDAGPKSISADELAKLQEQKP